MKQTKQILYYASSKTKFFYKKEEVCRYYIETKDEKLNAVGKPQCLIDLAEHFRKFYSKYSSQIELVNCTDELKEIGLRPLTNLEEEILLSTLKQESKQ